MDQAGILRKFIQGVKAMSEGDEERGEDNFGSDFMVSQTPGEPPSSRCSCSPATPPLDHFHPHPSEPPALTPVSQAPLLFPSLVSVYSPGGESWAATLPALFLFLPFPGFTWRPSIVSHRAEKAQPAAAAPGEGQQNLDLKRPCHFPPKQPPTEKLNLSSRVSFARGYMLG